MKFVEQNSKEVIATKVKVAELFVDRAIGLMFKNELEGYDGLLIHPCKSIHTFFMKMNIDVIFLDNDFKIIKLIRDMKPWRMTIPYYKATKVLEMKGGKLNKQLKTGDYLEGICLD